MGGNASQDSEACMIDIKAELAERFASCLDHYYPIERAELDSVIEIFGTLCETVDDIPAPLIEHTQKLAAFVGPDKFEAALGNALSDVGWKFTPVDAADFLTRVNRSLPFLRAA
jgi:hypothetical protein